MTDFEPARLNIGYEKDYSSYELRLGNWAKMVLRMCMCVHMCAHLLWEASGHHPSMLREQGLSVACNFIKLPGDRRLSASPVLG